MKIELLADCLDEITKSPQGERDAIIKRAYRRLIMKHHPDCGGTEEQFIQLKQEFDYLMNSTVKNIDTSKITSLVTVQFDLARFCDDEVEVDGETLRMKVLKASKNLILALSGVITIDGVKIPQVWFVPFNPEWKYELYADINIPEEKDTPLREISVALDCDGVQPVVGSFAREFNTVKLAVSGYRCTVQIQIRMTHRKGDSTE